MKQIVIISGKGETGKTVLTASFAALARNAIFADCDVDAAELHLLLKSEIKETHEFQSGKRQKLIKSYVQNAGIALRYADLPQSVRILSWMLFPVKDVGFVVISARQGR